MRCFHTPQDLGTQAKDIKSKLIISSRENNFNAYVKLAVITHSTAPQVFERHISRKHVSLTEARQMQYPDTPDMDSKANTLHYISKKLFKSLCLSFLIREN